ILGAAPGIGGDAAPIVGVAKFGVEAAGGVIVGGYTHADTHYPFACPARMILTGADQRRGNAPAAIGLQHVEIVDLRDRFFTKWFVPRTPQQIGIARHGAVHKRYYSDAAAPLILCPV